MISDCCCSKTLKMCSVNICDGIIDLGVVAQTSGIFKLMLNFLGGKVTIEQEFDEDEEIIFNISSLNENFEYSGKLFEPDDDQVILNKDGVEYDCFKFSTYINQTISNVVES